MDKRRVPYSIPGKNAKFPGFEAEKFQITSTKSQINLKIQYLMTKKVAKGWYYFDFSRIEENIFFNSLASRMSLFASLAFSRSFVSWINLSQ